MAGFAGSLKVFVAQNASLTDVHWTMSGEIVLMTLVGGLGTVFGPVVGAFVIIAMQQYLAGFGQWVTVIQGVDLRRLRADVPPRRDRRDRALFPAIALNRPIFGGILRLYKAVDDPVPGAGRRALSREMVYDSFVTGRPGGHFRNDGHDQCCVGFAPFLPKEERFFDLFARHSQTVVQGALALQGMLRGGDETPVFCQRVNQFENDADNITREVLTAVRRTFITPFDRGDIKNLITSMDDAIDQMQQTAKAVMLFEVRTFEPPMREMGDAAGRVRQSGRPRAAAAAVDRRQRRDADRDHRGDSAKLEGRVDDLHDIGLKELFLKHRNANTMDFIVGAEIYDHLEKVADRFDDVANEINSIVIEQV